MQFEPDRQHACQAPGPRNVRLYCAQVFCNAADMSNFSDRENRDLVRLAKVYEDEGVNVSWAQVAQRMKYSKKSAVVLRRRMQTDGALLNVVWTYFMLSLVDSNSSNAWRTCRMQIYCDDSNMGAHDTLEFDYAHWYSIHEGSRIQIRALVASASCISDLLSSRRCHARLWELEASATRPSRPSL